MGPFLLCKMEGENSGDDSFGWSIVQQCVQGIVRLSKMYNGVINNRNKNILNYYII